MVVGELSFSECGIEEGLVIRSEPRRGMSRSGGKVRRICRYWERTQRTLNAQMTLIFKLLKVVVAF
jgi:hypothetical protein